MDLQKFRPKIKGVQLSLVSFIHDLLRVPKILQGNFLLPICTERLTPSFAHLLLCSLDFKRGCKTPQDFSDKKTI